MNIRNKILSTVLVFAMLLTALTLNSLQANAVNYYTYTIKNNEATIYKCSQMISGDVIVPSKSSTGYPVTAIGAEAFFECYNITSLKIPDNISTIGEYAFGCCTNITSIDLPSNIKTIEYGTFYCCSSLNTINLPNGLHTIGAYAFDECLNLSDIYIPSSVSKIGDCAFYMCSNLSNIHITDIAAWCNIEFESIYYANPFRYADNLYLNDIIVTDLVVPQNIKKVNNYAFRDYDKLLSVKFSEGVESIGTEAFYSCDALKEVVIPKSVANVANGAFNRCSSLTDVYYSGTEQEWNHIIIDENNEYLTSANMHFLYGHEHSFGEWIERSSLTCTTNGEEYRICSSCGEEETRIATAEGHIYNSVVTPPTCLEDGYTTHTCPNCNDSYTDSLTSALGHSFSDWIERTPVTCTENGEDYRVCSGCSKEETRSITAMGHDFDTKYTIDKYPTENENGSKSKHCKRCEEITDVTVIQGRIIEYRYRDKETTSSQEELTEPWIWYKTTTKEVHSSYAYIYLKCADTNGTGTSSGYTSSQADNWKYENSNKYCFHGGKTEVYRYMAKYTGVYPEFIYSTSNTDIDYTKYAPDGRYWRFQYCKTQTAYDMYHYYRWTEWSDWSREQVSATDNRIVETKIRYTDITLANEEVNSLRLGLLSETTDESMDCNNDGIVDLLDLVLMHNAREDVKTVSGTNNSEPQNEPVEQSAQAPETAYYDDKMKQIA